MANKGNKQDDKIISKTGKINPKIHKILFAEDLMNYFLQKNSLPAVVISTELQREKGNKLFDHNLRRAAEFLINTVGINIDHACRYIMENNFNNVERFDYYANTLKAKVIGSGYDCESFFYYSVFLAHLASKLFAQKFNSAPYMAMNLIIEKMDLNRFRSTKKVHNLVVQKYEKTQQESVNKVEQPSSHRKDESFVQASDVQMCIPSEQLSHCKGKEDNIERSQQKSVNKVKQPLSHRKDESFVQASDVQMCISSEQLSHCKGKEDNIEREESARGKASKCREEQQHVVNYISSKSQLMDDEYIPSISTFQSPLFSDFEEVKTFEFDPPDTNLDTVRSSSCIAVPGPSGAESANLNSQECYYGDFSEDENRQQWYHRLYDYY